MILKIEKKDFQSYLFFHFELSQERLIFEHCLVTWSFENLFDSFTFKNEKIFGILRYKVVQNNDDFVIFLLRLRNKNVQLKNVFLDSWIESLLEKSTNLREVIKKQNLLYSQMINIHTLKNQINTSFFNKNFQPKEFQIAHSQFALSYRRSANFSSPGAGKTIIAYMVVCSLFADHKINTLVVVGPKSAKTAWFEEWRVVTKLELVYVSADFNLSEHKNNYIESINDSFFHPNKLNVVFINFHKFQDCIFLSSFLQKFIHRKIFLIVDEAHYIKNRFGNMHKNLSKLSSQLDYVLLLTGTPLPRFFEEGSYVMNFLFPNIKKEGLMDQDFQFASQTTSSGTLLNYSFKKRLIVKFQKFFRRKSKHQLVVEKLLEDMKRHLILVNISDCEQLILEGLKELGFQNCLDQKTINQMHRTLVIRRMQASSYPPLLKKRLDQSIKEMMKDTYDEEEKAEMESELKLQTQNKTLDDVISQIIDSSKMYTLINDYINEKKIPQRWNEALKVIQNKPNERIVVWDVFKDSMFAFKNFLQKRQQRKVFLINGDVLSKDRDNIITNFKSVNNNDAILIASAATIAESISLHKHVHTAIYLYKNYVGSHFMQSKDRIHRLVGKDETTFVKNIYLIEAGKPSIDQMISQNLEEKEKQQQEFID